MHVQHSAVYGYQFIEKHKQHNSKLLKCDIMRTMSFKGQKGRDGTNNCP